MKDGLVAVLFVCTGNAGRSQMAQAMFSDLAQGKAFAESAGVEPWDNLHPVAVQVMYERGLDLSGHYPKPVADVADRSFQVVVTLGDPAREKLPQKLARNAQWLHWDIADPADADGTKESKAVFTATADAIEKQLLQLLDLIAEPGEERGV